MNLETAVAYLDNLDTASQCELPVSRVPTGDPIFLSSPTESQWFYGYFVSQFFSAAVFGFKDRLSSIGPTI